MCQCGEVLSLILRGQTQKDCVPVWRAADSSCERKGLKTLSQCGELLTQILRGQTLKLVKDCVPVWRTIDSRFERTKVEMKDVGHNIGSTYMLSWQLLQ